jgi:imidazolonepropionase-like amidohydrolase
MISMAALTVLRAGWLFDGTGSPLVPEPAVLIEGSRIVAVTSSDEAPADADVVVLAGATLLPGLVDTHVHLAFDASRDPVGALSRRSDDETVQAMTRAARDALRGGVTTIRDLGDPSYLSLGLRGRPDMPTIVASGPPITTPRGHCHFLGGGVEPSAAAVRAAVREHAERGVDVIKVMASGGTLTPGTDRSLSQFPPEVLRALADEAHRLGFAVTMHAHAADAIADAVNSGADGIEHMTFWTADGVDAPEDLIRLISDRRIVAGLTMGIGSDPPFSVSAASPEIAARMPGIVATAQRLLRAGAVTAFASDAGISPAKPHDAVRRAPAALRVLGLGQAEALRAVTSGNAAACGVGDRKGRIAAGYDADILAVDGDPLADPEALHRIRAVFARGVSVAL